MKKKIFALVEIAIVLCSVFLLVIPTIAADQNQTMQKASASEVTTASENDYILGVYGNANEDDTIDMRDLTYVKLIFFGKKPETELADAKYDGKINPLDFIQIKLIIVGKEKELTIVDVFGEAVTVHKPVQHIVIGFNDIAEILRALNAKDMIVGIDNYVKNDQTFFPELSKLPEAGNVFKPNYEAILSLYPDIYMHYGSSLTAKKECEEKLPGVTVFFPGISTPTTPETFVKNVKKLGYILDRKDVAEEFIDWYNGYMDKIKSRTDGLLENEKPKVFVEMYYRPGETLNYAWLNPMCDIAGGRNIAVDLGKSAYVDIEWIIVQNPDIILAGMYPTSTICGYEIDDSPEVIAAREEILNCPELAHVTAVKTEHVYMIDHWHFTWGPSHIIYTAYLSKWFHPELFEDLDPKAIHQEYLTEFQGLDYDLDEHGVFVYPEPS